MVYFTVLSIMGTLFTGLACARLLGQSGTLQMTFIALLLLLSALATATAATTAASTAKKVM